MHRLKLIHLSPYPLIDNLLYLGYRENPHKNMSAIFLQLIQQLNSAVFVLVAILIIAFWAIYKLGGIVNTFDLFKNKNSELDKHVETIKENLATIKATTQLLYDAHLSTVKAHSPISLTEKGMQISTDLKLAEKVGIHWDEIKDKITKRAPANPYDIQVVAMDIARACFDSIFSEAERNEIKLYAYKTGNNLLEIFPIIGILARDKFLEESGLTPKAVDEHTPK